MLPPPLHGLGMRAGLRWAGRPVLRPRVTMKGRVGSPGLRRAAQRSDRPAEGGASLGSRVVSPGSGPPQLKVTQRATYTEEVYFSQNWRL